MRSFIPATWLFTVAMVVFDSEGRADQPRPVTTVLKTSTVSDLQVDTVKKGTSSRGVRRRAIDELNIRDLPAASRETVDDVLKQLSLFRRLPILEFEAHPDVYRFLAHYPDVTVSIWRALKISNFQLARTGPNDFRADAGDGSVGTIRIVHRDASRILIRCDGLYSSPLLVKPIRTSAIIHLQTRFGEGADKTPVVTHVADLFVSFPSSTVEAAAKLISPISNMIADRNFREVSLFVQMMTIAMGRQPGWVDALASRLDGVEASRRQELGQITARVYREQRQRTREIARQPQERRRAWANPSRRRVDRIASPAKKFE